MSTEKKSPIEKAAESLDFEKLSENEKGQLAGGFSDAVEDMTEAPADGGGINISKCYCGTTPAH